jgi:hypothetical protein
MTKGRLHATLLLLAPSCHGVMGAPIHLLRESRHVGSFYTTDRWAWSPLARRVAQIAGHSELFAILDMPRTIPGMITVAELIS